MKAKNNKIKRVVAIYLAVVFVLSAVAIFGVSAKTYTWEHTVEIECHPTYRCNVGTSIGADGGRMSDTFSSYPTIYGNYTKSVNKARAWNYEEDIYYTWQPLTLYENGGTTMVTYGNNLEAGDYEVQYENVSHGGCRANAILSRSY